MGAAAGRGPGRGGAGRGAARGGGGARGAADAGLPLRHPAALAAATVAAAVVALSVTTLIWDPDLGQHLTVGRAIWQLGGVPQVHLWSWPAYGRPDVLPSWGFRALLAPFWEWGGLPGLYAWRWLTTLGAFAALWAAARVMGARGLSPLVALVACALVYRQRSQVRPETLVAVLFALQVLALEARRARPAIASWARDPVWWTVPVALAWANVHVSYWMGFALLAFHALDALLGGGPAPPAGRGRLARAAPFAAAGLAGAAASFLNPFGWRALWQPFEYWLTWRHEPIYRSIGELAPVDWGVNLTNGLPALVVAWPALALWRAARGRADAVELLLCALFTWLGLTTQRFLGFYALAAAPYLGRGLAEALAAARRGRPAPAPWARAALAASACVAAALPELARPEVPLGLGFARGIAPEAACERMAEWGVSGRGLNPFGLSGHLLLRFWPDRGRLPFMDIHQTGTAAERAAYQAAMGGGAGWRALDDRHRFDWVLMHRHPTARVPLLDALDADTAFALVFVDDAAALWVRRSGAMAPVAAARAYALLPGGDAGLARLGQRAASDSALRREIAAELARQMAESPRHAEALRHRSNLALLEARWEDARRDLEAAAALAPNLAGVHLRLAAIALEQGRPRDALAALARERRASGASADVLAWEGEARERLGERDRAAARYRAALARDPRHARARAGLARLGAR